MPELKIDPELRSLIPPLSDEELKGLEESLLAEGCRDAIVVWGDTIVDGHNRYEICQKHHISFKVIEKTFSSLDEVKTWMIVNQFSRRNINKFVRAELALKLKPLIAAKAKERQGRRTDLQNNIVHKNAQCETTCSKNNIPHNYAESKETRDLIAEQANVSRGTIDKAEKILKKASPEIVDKLRAGKMSINEAEKITRRELARKEKEANIEKIKSGEVIAPVGTYDVIVLDPPWQMEKIERDVAPDQAAFDYPTMTEKELEILDIPFNEDCHVFMWTTHKHLPMALRLFTSWGVKYVLTMVWHKNGGFQPFGLPQYNCEFILYGRKGTPVFLETKAFPVCFNAPRGKHSEKPEEFYELLRRVTGGRRLDMFNRRKIEGFDTWGNESGN